MRFYAGLPRICRRLTCRQKVIPARERAAGGIPVAVTCRVLKLARAPYYRWLKNPGTASEWVEAKRANALFDAYQNDLQFGYRLLADEARDAGWEMIDRTAWKITSENNCWSSFGKKRSKNGKTPGKASSTCVRSRTLFLTELWATLSGQE